MKALILVDLQNDFLPGGALAVPQGDEVIPVANRVQPAFDLVVATRDWHPAAHGSFAASHPGRQVGERATLGGRPQVLWPTHCVQHTRGADFAAALDATRVARVFAKGTDPAIDSYSGFFDDGLKKATGLGEFLRERRVTEVYVLGLATDYCVKATALDARRLGFTTRLIVDGCRGVELHAGDVAHALAEMRNAGVEFVTSESLLPTRAATPPLQKFRKKPVIVEAAQWWRPGDHPVVVHPVPPHVPILEHGREVAPTPAERVALPVGTIQTLEGWMLVRPGDFVIRGVTGEHYACKPDIFLKTYEPVPEAPAA